MSRSVGIKYSCPCGRSVASPTISCLEDCSVHNIAELMCCKFFLKVQCDLLVLTYHSSNKVVHLHICLESMFGALGMLQYTWKLLRLFHKYLAFTCTTCRNMLGELN